MPAPPEIRELPEPAGPLTTPAPLLAAEATPALSRRDRSAVIDRIRSLMAFWGITEDDLLAPPSADEPTAADSGPLPVKYRHPATGETWDGQGPHPDWLRRALLQEGLRVDELKPPAATD